LPQSSTRWLIAEEARCGTRCDRQGHLSIGGAGLAAAAIELGLVDEFRMFRNPIGVGGTPSCRRSPKTFG
jgi:dihydrofolate reductase